MTKTRKSGRRTRRTGRGLGEAAPAKVRHLEADQYQEFLAHHKLAPLARGQCRTMRDRIDGKQRSLTLCRLPTGPVLITGRK